MKYAIAAVIIVACVAVAAAFYFDLVPGFEFSLSMNRAYADVTVVTGCASDNPFHLYRHYGDGSGVIKYQGESGNPVGIGTTLSYASDYEICDSRHYVFDGKAVTRYDPRDEPPSLTLEDGTAARGEPSEEGVCVMIRDSEIRGPYTPGGENLKITVNLDAGCAPEVMENVTIEQTDTQEAEDQDSGEDVIVDDEDNDDDDDSGNFMGILYFLLFVSCIAVVLVAVWWVLWR